MRGQRSPLGERGAQGFPGAPLPIGDPTRWGGRVEQAINVPALGSATFQTSQSIRVQCTDNYARLWQLFGTLAADADMWQAFGKTSLWRSALLLISFGAGQNTIEVAYDIATGVAQLCGAYPFAGPGTPFQGRTTVVVGPDKTPQALISCPFYYPPFSPLIPGNTVNARLETSWVAGEVPIENRMIALDLAAAPYAIATGA